MRTPIAQGLWNNGKCLQPPGDWLANKNFMEPLDVRTLDADTTRRTETRDFDAE